MFENVTQLPVTKAKLEPSSTFQAPFESLRQEINRMFDDFGWGSWPLRRSFSSTEPMMFRGLTRTGIPAVDLAESEKGYEITAEMPGIDEKNIEVKVANGILTVKGEKQEHKQEKKKDYYLQERHYGSFERSFEIPETVDSDKIEASFMKGVLTVTLPKKVDAQKPAKKIEVKAA
jgi:HSP20 family protein